MTTTWVNHLAGNVSRTLIIGIILIIAIGVVAILRLYCILCRHGHDWEAFPGDDMFIPTRPDQCRACGKRRPAQRA